MKILFTGASSFTGLWFVEALAHAGHEVTATFQRKLTDYEGLPALRAQRIAASASTAEICPFGSPRFLKLAGKDSWDLLCHHAAEVTDYKSPSFDVVAALASNTKGLAAVLSALGDTPILLTGSVFEQHEGIGSDGLRAVSPYGLSKGLTSEMFRYYCEVKGVPLGKFVIPNPFGPYEKQNFTSYMASTWLKGESVKVSQPAYVRDNVHVSLLARAYARFAEQTASSQGYTKINPSGYAGPTAEFVKRFSGELAPRLGVPCQYNIADQRDFTEPRVRLNTDPLNAEILGWNESRAWDELAQYYLENYRP